MSNQSKSGTTIDQINLEGLTDRQLLDLANSLQVLDENKRYNKQQYAWDVYINNPGYWKHLMYMEKGAEYRERALIAGNRTGKTYTACLEMSFHLNGRYPKEWKGKRFNKPIKAWSAGITHDTTKDILQKELLGQRFDLGTGFIPKADIEKVNSKAGVTDGIQDVYVRHYTNGVFDGFSELTFKSYVQGVEAFMGTAQDVIHLDEEPSTVKIYNECLIRTMTTNGIIMCTFTPLLGLSQVVMSFLPGGRFPENGIGEAVNED